MSRTPRITERERHADDIIASMSDNRSDDFKHFHWLWHTVLQEFTATYGPHLEDTVVYTQILGEVDASVQATASAERRTTWNWVKPRLRQFISALTTHERFSQPEQYAPPQPSTPGFKPCGPMETFVYLYELFLDAVRQDGNHSNPQADTAEVGTHTAGLTSHSTVLNRLQNHVLLALAEISPSVLATVDLIAEYMPKEKRYATRSIGPAVNDLIAFGLASRPNGPRQGAQLTSAGRTLAQQIAA